MDNKRSRWTAEDDNLLKELYPNYGAKYLLTKISNKTLVAIKLRANRLKLKRNKCTDEMDGNKEISLYKAGNIYTISYSGVRAQKILEKLDSIPVPYNLKRKWDKV